MYALPTEELVTFIENEVSLKLASFDETGEALTLIEVAEIPIALKRSAKRVSALAALFFFRMETPKLSGRRCIDAQSLSSCDQNLLVEPLRSIRLPPPLRPQLLVHGRNWEPSCPFYMQSR